MRLFLDDEPSQRAFLDASDSYEPCQDSEREPILEERAGLVRLIAYVTGPRRQIAARRASSLTDWMGCVFDRLDGLCL